MATSRRAGMPVITRTTRAKKVKPRRGDGGASKAWQDFGVWGRDPAKSNLQVSRWLIVPKISLRVRSATHHFLNGREALAGSARASSPRPQTDRRLSNLVDQLSQ